MNIALITCHQYPVGTAMTNRIRSYLEVLAKMGHQVRVMIYRPSEAQGDIQNERQGILNGVNYSSTAFSIVKPKNPILARLTWIYGYINCLMKLINANRKQHIDVIIQASSKSSLIPLVYLFTRLTKIKFVLENSEYPWFLLKKRLSNIWYRPLYLYVYYRLFDGVLVMTVSLSRYHRRYSKKSALIFHLPMTVDLNRFILNIPRDNYITYIGNKSYYKDGVGILLEAFIAIAGNNPDWKLMIIGDTSKDEEIVRRVQAEGLEHRIILKGTIHRDKVPELLCRSKILALARPDNLQSEGGFPTKLGEYLATGNLAVVTRVGEIPHYLEDGVSCLMAEPDSVESFAKSLSYAIVSYDQLYEVRKQGWEVCQSVFNSEIQGKRLDEFFKELLSFDQFD